MWSVSAVLSRVLPHDVMEPWFLESQAYRASCNYELVLFTAAVMNNRRSLVFLEDGVRGPVPSLSLEQLSVEEEENLQQNGMTFTYLDDEDEG